LIPSPPQGCPTLVTGEKEGALEAWIGVRESPLFLKEAGIFERRGKPRMERLGANDRGGVEMRGRTRRVKPERLATSSPFRGSW
jgi:hypothetical protein